VERGSQISGLGRCDNLCVGVAQLWVVECVFGCLGLCGTFACLASMSAIVDAV
ncbi:hypothetical protein ETH_00026035, partial [Eimeria tenella]